MRQKFLRENSFHKSEKNLQFKIIFLRKEIVLQKKTGLTINKQRNEERKRKTRKRKKWKIENKEKIKQRREERIKNREKIKKKRRKH